MGCKNQMQWIYNTGCTHTMLFLALSALTHRHTHAHTHTVPYSFCSIFHCHSHTHTRTHTALAGVCVITSGRLGSVGQTGESGCVYNKLNKMADLSLNSKVHLRIFIYPDSARSLVLTVKPLKNGR